MNTFKLFFKSAILAGLMLPLISSCSDDDDKGTDNPGTEIPGDRTYVLGLGVTTTEATSNYVLKTTNLMSGTISLINNGILQVGYRDFLHVGPNFYSIGGLGVNDVNVISLDASGNLSTKTGLTFDMGASDIKDVDGTGKTLLGVAVPSKPTDGLQTQFFLVDVATNKITKKYVAMNDVHPSADNWWGHSGIVVRGDKAFQTFYPINHATWATSDTDAAYVAIYSYPEFKLQEVIKDTRTGPAGAFGTRSGIFLTESGDIYTISHSGYGYSQATKAPAVLKIAAGTTKFDAAYYFKTEDVENGGRIVHALYIGNNKLFAEVSYGEQNGQWADAGLKFAIVDLKAKTITAVKDSPSFVGDGGRSFAAMYDDGKVYTSATVNNVRYIYQIDIATATAKRGAAIDATFVGGIARLK